jgi:Na+/proline symporter
VYFGLPLAMVILSATAVPIFHRAKVYTAYEYLERRFDGKTRALVSAIFLIQRGLSNGIALCATAIVLTAILGWPDQITILLMGSLAILYTATGGAKAVAWTEFPQMIVMLLGLIAALVTAVWMFPEGVGLLDAATVAGAAGKLRTVVSEFQWNDRYNLWSGVLGGMFLALAYFGCDQSQVQRYLTGRSVTHSRLSLMFNGVAKVPMQFLILFIGAVVFAFYNFEPPPMLFQRGELARIQASKAEYGPVAQRYEAAFEERRRAAQGLIEARRSGDGEARARGVAAYQQAHRQFEAARGEAVALAKRTSGGGDYNDTNYVFLSFVLRYLPAGVVGLVMAAIFAAAMSTISSEINSLATVTVVDLYQRFFRKGAAEQHYLSVAKAATVFWGVWAMVTAELGKNLGALIEVVNIVGSLFYGGLLGVFVLAFFFKRVGGTAAFVGVIAGEAAIFATALLTKISFLWYNVVGCGVVIAVAVAVAGMKGAGRQERAGNS